MSSKTSEMSGADTLEISTQSLNKKRVTAGKLDEVGETFTLKGIETKISDKNGEFYVLSGELESGQALEIVFSSAKLHRLLTDNWNKLVDKRINLSDMGAGFEREYVIKLVG